MKSLSLACAFVFSVVGLHASALPGNAVPTRGSEIIKKASFEETLERFPSPYGVIQQFRHIVPNGLEQWNYNECLNIGETSAPVTGVIDPLQQSALEENPGALFYPYYEKCVRQLVDNGFSSEWGTKANQLSILGEELAAEVDQARAYMCSGWFNKPEVCTFPPESFSFSMWYKATFKELTPQLQEKLMYAFVRYLGGPDAVLRRLKLIGGDETFGVRLLTAQDLAKFLVSEMLKMKNGEAALSLRDVYAETAILLRLGPALKH